MTTLHPHWQATDDEQPVRVSVDSLSGPGNADARPMTVRTASRKPAAIVGILAVLGVGYVALGGTLSLPGQVADGGSVSVHLTAKGADPASLTIAPGTTVEWVNDDAIPHVLSFGKLKVDGKPLETPPIFPGSTSRMLVPTNVKADTYSYNSKTSTLSGKIVVLLAAAASEASSSAPQADSNTSLVPLENIPSVPAQQENAQPSPVAADTVMRQPGTPDSTAEPRQAQVVLPVNFHTVGNPNQGPVEPLHSGAPLAQITQHRPSKTTDSGPALWVLVAITTGTLLVATRRAFR